MDGLSLLGTRASLLCIANMISAVFLHPQRSTPAHAGQVIEQDTADALLLADMNTAATAAMRLCPNLVTRPNSLEAVSDFVFNLGAGRLQASSLRSRINQGEWEFAAREFGKWVLAGGRRLPGLVLRREAERALFLAT